MGWSVRWPQGAWLCGHGLGSRVGLPAKGWPRLCEAARLLQELNFGTSRQAGRQAARQASSQVGREKAPIRGRRWNRSESPAGEGWLAPWGCSRGRVTWQLGGHWQCGVCVGAEGGCVREGVCFWHQCGSSPQQPAGPNSLLAPHSQLPACLAACLPVPLPHQHQQAVLQTYLYPTTSAGGTPQEASQSRDPPSWCATSAADAAPSRVCSMPCAASSWPLQHGGCGKGRAYHQPLQPWGVWVPRAVGSTATERQGWRQRQQERRRRRWLSGGNAAGAYSWYSSRGVAQPPAVVATRNLRCQWAMAAAAAEAAARSSGERAAEELLVAHALSGRWGRLWGGGAGGR